jgi:hypothetical protein
MEEERSNIIKAITTPLGFFALSLLIVEGFLGIVLGFTKNQSQWFYLLGMIIGAGLFVGVVRGVWLLVKHDPENIVLAGKDYIEREKIQAEGNRTTLFKKSEENTTKNIKFQNYYDEDEPSTEEIDRAGDMWISSEIDRMRGK